MTDPSDPDRIAAEFARRRRTYLLASLPLLAMIGVFIALDNLAPKGGGGVLAWIAIAVSAVVVVVCGRTMWRAWRCPACEKRLPPVSPWVVIRQCPQCRAQLTP
jgi:hypothetical protein